MVDAKGHKRYVFLCMKSDKQLYLIKEQLLSALAQHGMLTMLFDNLPGITFFVKSLDSILLSGSRSFYERLGYINEEQMLGKTDFDFFPTHMAEHFRADDKEVMQKKLPKVQIVELFFNRQGIPDWYITNKFPILDAKGNAIGLMGTTQSYTGAKENITPYLLIDKAVEIIRSSFREKINVSDLATTVGLSERQFLRRFNQAFACSPQAFILKTRMSAACRLLSQSDDKITTVAVNCGFADASSFVQLFRREMGETPLRYRQRYRMSDR